MPYTANYTKTVNYSQGGTHNNSFSQSDTFYTSITGKTRRMVDFTIPDSVAYTGISFPINFTKLSFLSFYSETNSQYPLVISGIDTLGNPPIVSPVLPSGISLNSSNERKSIFVRTGNGFFENSDGMIIVNPNYIIEGFWIYNPGQATKLTIECISDDTDSQYGVPD